MEEKQKKRGRWRKIVLGALLLVVVALAVLLLNIDTIARIQINKTLNRYLVAGGNLASIDIHLLEGRVSLSGLVIHPPPGFESHPLLSLDVFEVDTAPWALIKGTVVIENLMVKGLSLNVVRDKKGRLSPLELLVAQTSDPEPQPENQSQRETSLWIPVVHAHAIQVEDVSLRLLDRMVKEDWAASLGAGLKVEGLQLQDILDLDILVKRVDIKLSDILVDQPPGFSREPLLSIHKFDLASRGLDLKTSRIPVSDIILDTLSVSLERNTGREINLIKLTESWLPTQSKSGRETSAPPPATPAESSKSGFEIPEVTVDNIHLSSMSAQLLDSMDGQAWQAGFDNLDIRIKGVEVGDLAEQAIALASMELDLKGVAIDQPPGFSETPLLSMGNFSLASQGIDLGSSKVSISDVGLDELSVSLERNADREINIVKLTESLLPPKAGGESGSPAPSVTPTESSGPAFEPPPVTVDNIHFNIISAQLLDSMDGQTWRAGFDGLDIRMKNVEVGDLKEQAVSLASLNFDLHGITVDQPPGFSETPLLSMGSFKLASRGIDLGESEVSISDVILDTLSISVERNAKNEVNLITLKESWLPDPGESNGDKRDSPIPPINPSDSDFKMPTVKVDNIELKSISAQVLAAIEEHPWRAGFGSLDIHVTGVEGDAEAEPAISLASFDLDLKGMAVDQPPGFNANKLFYLDQFRVVSDKANKPDNELVVKQVQLKGLTSSVTMRADGVTSLKVLKEVLLGTDEGGKPSMKEQTGEKEEPSREFRLQPVLFEQISMNGGPVTYRDEVFAKEPLEATLNDIQMEIKGLYLFTDKKEVEPASAALSFEFEQPGDLPTAYFGTLANVGPVGDGVPMVNTQVRLVGLKLDTLGSLVPKTTRTALGATGLDAGLAMAMDADSINLNASVLTDRLIRYEGITVQGPLDKPVVKIGPVMTGVFGRVSDGLVNLGKGGLKSGVNIAEGGAQAAKELGAGAVKIGANLGKSLFETTAGVVTFNKEKVKEGAQGSTKGTVGLTKDSVKGSGEAAGGGFKSSASDLKGQDRVEAWEQDIPIRYQTSMEQARTVLKEMPYPPVTE